MQSLQAEVTEMKNADNRDLRHIEPCPWILAVGLRGWAPLPLLAVPWVGPHSASPSRGWAATPSSLTVWCCWFSPPHNQPVRPRRHQSLPTDWCPCCRWIQPAQDDPVKNIVMDGDTMRPLDGWETLRVQAREVLASLPRRGCQWRKANPWQSGSQLVCLV